MKNGRLRESAVSFDAATHTYMLDGRVLSGVTPIVNWVYDKTYEGISDDVLRRAAEHGKSVHLDCQMKDAGFDVQSREAKAYGMLKDERGLETLANEWLVDDGKDIASSIDVVFTDYSIADIKTTSSIHMENVELQLSVYAWLLERMNPGVVVPTLYVIWLPRERYGNPCMLKVERIGADVCEMIVGMYLKGESADKARDLLGLPIVKEDVSSMPMEIRDAENELIRLEVEAKEVKRKSEELREGLLRLMEQNGIKKYESERLVLSYVEGSERMMLDSSKVKNEHPEVYAACMKRQQTKSSLRIKIK